MSTTCLDPKRRQRGFALLAGIFILVVLAALAGYIVSMTATQNATLVEDLQSTRALQAARAGIEWGTARWLNENTCSGTTSPHITFADANLSGFTTIVTATQVASGGAKFCTLEATATPTSGAVGSIAYVERQLQAVIEGN